MQKDSMKVFGLVAMTCGALFLSACGSGPTTIRGRITDATGSPIAKAEVATQPETDVVVSNSRGFFVLRQRITELGESLPIKPGKYRFTIRKFGFEELKFDVNVKAGSNKIKSLQMRERTPDIEDTAPSETQDDQTAPMDSGIQKGH